MGLEHKCSHRQGIDWLTLVCWPKFDSRGEILHRALRYATATLDLTVADAAAILSTRPFFRSRPAIADYPAA